VPSRSCATCRCRSTAKKASLRLTNTTYLRTLAQLSAPGTSMRVHTLKRDRPAKDQERISRARPTAAWG
jgi:hypothetical protein